LLKEHDMTLVDVACSLSGILGHPINESELKAIIWGENLDLETLNLILDVISYEMVPIFRKRWPVTYN